MSIPTLSQQTQTRLPKIKYGLLQRQTRQQIGVDCHVTEKTIRRDIQAWTKTDDFLDWIREVWLDKYAKVDDVEAFRQATKILIKTLPQYSETKIDVHERIEEYVKIDVTENEDEILSKAAAILARKDKSHKIH